MNGQLWHVEAPHFCAGIIVRMDVINEGAPILGWARGRNIQWFRRYCARKGWKCYTLPTGRATGE